MKKQAEVINDKEAENEGQIMIKERFLVVYRQAQQARLVVAGVVGPIFIYAPEFLYLFISYLTSAQVSVNLPWSWSLEEKASYLYDVVERLGTYLKYPTSR